MPTFLQSNDISLVWDSFDMSANIKGHGFPRDADTVELTTMGKTSKVYGGALKDATISVDLFWSAGSSGLDEKMDATLGTKKTIVYKPKNTTASVSNPQYTADAILKHWEPTGEVGGYMTATAEFQLSDTITRATS